MSAGSRPRRIAATELDVLVGDLNAPIDAPELEPLGTSTDAFAEPVGDSARHSTDDAQAIDHVLVRRGSVVSAGARRA